MLYLSEIYFRFLYCAISFIICFIILFFFKDYFLTFLISKSFFFANFNFLNLETAFVLNSPLHLIDINFYFCFLLAFFFCIPLFLWNFYSFLYSSLTVLELYKFNFFIYKFIIQLYIFNSCIIFLVFPYFWSFFEYLSFSILLFSNINIEYEPNYFNYIFLLYKTLKIFNGFAIFVFILFLTIKNLDLTTYLKYITLFNSFFVFFLIIVLIFFFDFSFLYFFFISLFLFSFILFKKVLLFSILFNKIKYYAIKKNC